MMGIRGLTKRIRAIRFALLSPDEIRRMSATKIITADTYDDDGFPIDMGLMDSHLGVIEPGLRCRTAEDHSRQAHDVPGERPQADAEGSARAARADPERGPPSPRDQSGCRAAGVDDPHGPPRPARHGASVDHAGKRGPLRGRP